MNETSSVKHSRAHAVVLDNSYSLFLHCAYTQGPEAAETLAPNLGWEIKQIFYAHDFSRILGGSCDSETPFITAVGQETKTFQKAFVRTQRRL